MDKYPERYEKLTEAFRNACADEAYIQMLKDASVYDSAVLESGSDYSGQMTQMAEEVEKVVAPLFSGN